MSKDTDVAEQLLEATDGQSDEYKEGFMDGVSKLMDILEDEGLGTMFDRPEEG